MCESVKIMYEFVDSSPYEPTDGGAHLRFQNTGEYDLAILCMNMALHGRCGAKNALLYTSFARSCLYYGARTTQDIENFILYFAPPRLRSYMRTKMAQPPPLLTANGIVTNYINAYDSNNYVDCSPQRCAPASKIYGMDHGGAETTKIEPDVYDKLQQVCHAWNSSCGGSKSGRPDEGGCVY